METESFKNLFDVTAQTNGYEKAFGSWFKESTECIVVLELQRSNFSKLYYLHIKVFVQGLFRKIYLKNKEIAKNSMGHINGGSTIKEKDIFDLEVQISEEERKLKLEKYFADNIIPFTDQVLTKSGIQEMIRKGTFVTPAVKEELEKLTPNT